LKRYLFIYLFIYFLFKTNYLKRGVFKTRATKLEKALKSAGFAVTINPEKPRKGSFVVTVEGAAEPALELLNMARPFTALKGVDMDEIAAKIIDA
jgi:translation initiation factor 1 (eIF-1/SUI1)